MSITIVMRAIQDVHYSGVSPFPAVKRLRNAHNYMTLPIVSPFDQAFEMS
jgi:hypothetical protein